MTRKLPHDGGLTAQDVHVFMKVSNKNDETKLDKSPVEY